jgi:hypothetical protein
VSQQIAALDPEPVAPEREHPPEPLGHRRVVVEQPVQLVADAVGLGARFGTGHSYLLLWRELNNPVGRYTG